MNKNKNILVDLLEVNDCKKDWFLVFDNVYGFFYSYLWCNLIFNWNIIEVIGK